MKKNKILIGIFIFLILLFLISVIFPFDFPTDSINASGQTRDLKQGDTIEQEIVLNHQNVKKMIFREATYGEKVDKISFTITLFDDKNEIVAKQDYDFKDLSDGQFIDFKIKNKNLKGKYLLKININELTNNQRFVLYTSEEVKEINSYKINDEEINEKTIFINICGYRKSYYYSFVILLIIIIYFIVLISKNIIKIDIKKNIYSLKWLIIYGFVSAIMVISFVVSYYINKRMIHYYFRNPLNIELMKSQNTNVLIGKLLLIVLLCTLLLNIVYIINYLKKNNHKLEYIFLLLAIPIGMMYMLCINPMNVPDSHYHYFSAYQPLISIDKNHTVMVPEIVNEERYSVPKTIGDYYRLIKKGNEYKNVPFFEQRGRYHFLDYIPTTTGIVIGKILKISPYLSLYVSKFISYILFLLVGFYIVKNVPIGKNLFMVYLLSPTFIQQVISISVDSCINMASLLFIVKVLKIKDDNNEINYKDIFILTILLILSSIAKINYVLIGFIIFILWKQLIKMDKKKWMVSIGSILIVFVCILIGFRNATAPSQLQEGIIDFTSYVNSDLKRSFFVYINSFFDLYEHQMFESFGLHIGWDRAMVPVNTLSQIMYFIALFITFIYKEKSKIHFNKLEKILMISIYIVSLLFVAYALYTGWTYPGLLTINGIQGRYFIPFNILLLLVIYDLIKHKEYENKNLIPMLLFISHILTVIDIVKTII